MDGRQLLSNYIEREKGNGANQAKLARASKCSEGHLSLFLKGKRELSISLANRISAATAGAVPVSALIPEKMAAAKTLIEAAE